MNRVYKSFASGIGAAAVGYAGYFALTYAQYGRCGHRAATGTLLDSLMPDYEVSEVHQSTVRAPAHVTFAAAHDISFSDSALVRAIFALRAMPSRLAGASTELIGRRTILEETMELGWRQIGNEPGRRIIMGAVTQPWKQNVEFRGLSPGDFSTFNEPGHAKIAWTIEVDPLDSTSSVFRTETRVVTTDPISREKFRRYWSFLSPGIILIRYEMLRLVKSKVELGFRETETETHFS